MKAFVSTQPESRGFALVVTLSLMILLTVIAVGLLSLSAISMRTSSLGSAQAEARANARLALMLAIGELQKQLGPDQRVSMTADQRVVPGGDGGESSSAAGNRQWTGVFDSWPMASSARPSPVFRSWLVSGDPSQFSRLNAAETELTGASAIELVGAGTLGPAVAGLVKAPVMNLTASGTQTGHLAWWVGDQSVKAAVSTKPPSSDTSLAVLRQNLQSAPPIASRLAAAGNVKPFADLKMDDPGFPS